MRSFVKIKPSQIDDITLSFTDIGTCKSCPVRDFITSQMCLLALFAKIKFSRKFANLQYIKVWFVMASHYLCEDCIE